MTGISPNQHPIRGRDWTRKGGRNWKRFDNHHPAIVAHRPVQGLRAFAIGQFQVAEPAAGKIEGRMDAPVGAGAAALAQAAGVAQVQAAATPEGGRRRAVSGEQTNWPIMAG
jgi:hypothetical protein